jgi:hypothetical protein
MARDFFEALFADTTHRESRRRKGKIEFANPQQEMTALVLVATTTITATASTKLSFKDCVLSSLAPVCPMETAWVDATDNVVVVLIVVAAVVIGRQHLFFFLCFFPRCCPRPPCHITAEPYQPLRVP